MHKVKSGSLLSFLAHLGLVAAILPTYTSGQNSSPLTVEQIDSKEVQQTVDSLATVVNREYMDFVVAARIDKALRQWLAEGRYSDNRTAQALAITLTSDLYALTKDKHLAVAVVRDKTNSDESREADGHRSNFGVQRVEILTGNVGYVNFTAFYRPYEARDAIAAAMQMVRNADALIVDLRANAGGSPETVALVASYLFDAPGLPLLEIVPRSGSGRRLQTETGPLPGRNGRRPVFVLIDGRTFSGGEGLAFILQERHRAEVIGETTAGAANVGRPYPLNARFEVTVPTGKVQTGIGGSNWEGAGVVPDVKTSSGSALGIAHGRALRELIKMAPTGPWHDMLEREVKKLDQRRPEP